MHWSHLVHSLGSLISWLYVVPKFWNLYTFGNISSSCFFLAQDWSNVVCDVCVFSLDGFGGQWRLFFFAPALGWHSDQSKTMVEAQLGDGIRPC